MTVVDDMEKEVGGGVADAAGAGFAHDDDGIPLKASGP